MILSVVGCLYGLEVRIVDCLIGVIDYLIGVIDCLIGIVDF